MGVGSEGDVAGLRSLRSVERGWLIVDRCVWFAAGCRMECICCGKMQAFGKAGLGCYGLLMWQLGGQCRGILQVLFQNGCARYADAGAENVAWAVGGDALTKTWYH